VPTVQFPTPSPLTPPPGGGIPTFPPVPAGTGAPAGGGETGGGETTTPQPTMPEVPSTLKTIGEIVLLTSPAWGAVLLTRLMR
jgi:hypothetical protein